MFTLNEVVCIDGSTLANLATQGQGITTYNGTAQFTHVACGTFGGDTTAVGEGSRLTTAPTYGTPYNLPTTQLAQHTASTGSGIVIAATTGPASIGAPRPSPCLTTRCSTPAPASPQTTWSKPPRQLPHLAQLMSTGGK